MECLKCGGNNFAWAKKCDHCGEPLASSSAREPGPTVTPQAPDSAKAAREAVFRDAADALIAALARDSDVRDRAFYVLDRIRNPRAAAFLVDALTRNWPLGGLCITTDPHGWAGREGRLQAAKALGAVGDTSATEPLVAAMLSDGDPGIREAAATALGMLGDTRATGALLIARADGLVATATVDAALASLGGDAGACDDPFAPLLALINDPQEEVRWAAVRALGRAGYAPAADQIAALIEDSLRAPLTDSDAGRNSFIPAEIQIPV
jgi:HEAT repeat protein